LLKINASVPSLPAMLALKGGVEPKRRQDVVKGIVSLSFKFQRLLMKMKNTAFGQVALGVVKELKHHINLPA